MYGRGGYRAHAEILESSSPDTSAPIGLGKFTFSNSVVVKDAQLDVTLRERTIYRSMKNTSNINLNAFLRGKNSLGQNYTIVFDILCFFVDVNKQWLILFN